MLEYCMEMMVHCQKNKDIDIMATYTQLGKINKYLNLLDKQR